MKVYILLAAYATVAKAVPTGTELKLIASQPEDLLPPSQQKPSQEERSSPITYSQEISPCSTFGYGFKYEHGVGSNPFNYFYYSPPSDLGVYVHGRSSDEKESEEGKPQVRASEKKDKPRSSFSYGLASDIPRSPVISTSISNIKVLEKGSSAKLSGLSDYTSPISSPVLAPVVPTLNVNPYHAEPAIPVIAHPTPAITDLHHELSTHVAPYHSPYAYSEHHAQTTPVFVPFTHDHPIPQTVSYSSAGIHPAYTAESVFGNYGYSHEPVIGQSVGVFPYSNVGGCSTPVIGSCSPQIIFGYLTPIDQHYIHNELLYNVHSGHGHSVHNEFHTLYREDDTAQDSLKNGTISL